MPQPTTAIYFSESFPAAPDGDQLCLPQTDNAVPEQSVTFYPQRATTDLCGTVKPDGTTVTIDEDGTIHAVSTGGVGGGGTSASGGFLVCVVPAGTKDGSNTQFTLPAPVLAGSGYIYVRNGVTQRQLGTKAEFAVQGTQLTTSTPLQSDDWHEFYYVMGTPNSESGGGGVAPAGLPPLRGTAMSTSSGSVTLALPPGTQAADFAVAYVSGGPSPSGPSGWTQWTGLALYYKVLSSGDVAAGSISLNTSGAGAAGLAVFVGGTSGIREVDGNWGLSSINTAAVVTTSAVQATDYGLMFTQTSSGISCSIATPVPLQAVSDANASGALSAMLMAAGVNTVNFVVGPGTDVGGSQVLVIVEA